MRISDWSSDVCSSDLVASYAVTDGYFGKPYIDRDEERTEPIPHRNVHGGFKGTDTRFTFYFPSKEESRNRLFQHMEGGHAGHEHIFGEGPVAQISGGLAMAFRLGGYMVNRIAATSAKIGRA